MPVSSPPAPAHELLGGRHGGPVCTMPQWQIKVSSAKEHMCIEYISCFPNLFGLPTCTEKNVDFGTRKMRVQTPALPLTGGRPLGPCEPVSSSGEWTGAALRQTGSSHMLSARRLPSASSSSSCLWLMALEKIGSQNLRSGRDFKGPPAPPSSPAPVAVLACSPVLIGGSLLLQVTTSPFSQP